VIASGVQFLELWAPKSAKAHEVDNTRRSIGRVLSGELEYVFRDLWANPWCRDHGERGMLIEGHASGLEVRLRPQSNKTIASPFRGRFDLDHIRFTAATDDQIRSPGVVLSGVGHHVPAGVGKALQ